MAPKILHDEELCAAYSLYRATGSVQAWRVYQAVGRAVIRRRGVVCLAWTRVEGRQEVVHE